MATKNTRMHKKKAQVFVRFCVFRGHSISAIVCTRYLVAIVVAIVAVAIARADSAIARIDDATLTADEFSLFLGWHKALVARRLFPHAPVVTSAMWIQPLNGARPADILREEALRDALTAKAREAIYTERGLMRRISFAELETELGQENSRRANAIASGSVVYGPHRWTLDTYYRNRDAELLTRLRDQLRTETASAGARADSRPEALDQRIERLVHDRLAHAKVTIDRTAVASVPLP